ncbi:NAD(P)-dependent oxidoreductase [Sphaerisporangium flaviroseum]|uniref:NAD(P)-dependent oxidoreductase n=1 Tax=Sphaerisporangium flaviroseum TaxID=509199 RepID=A0ABP7IQX5_9ACTN
MQIAVLGMGNMGRAVARRLLGQGHEVKVWNRTPGKAAEVVQAGAVEASSPMEAARGAEAVLMSLADDRAVTDVIGRLADLGPAPEAPVVVDMSTVSPETSRGLQEVAPGRRFVAAPIIAAPQTVLQGMASGLLGGQRHLIERLEPLWPGVFSVHWFCGEDPGSATTFKLLNNYMLISQIAVVAEVVATAEAAGLDVKLLREVFDQWPTVSPSIRNRLDDVISGDHQGWFATRLGAKDVGHLVRVAESNGLSLPIAGLVERRYHEAAEGEWGEADIAAIVELLRGERRTEPGMTGGASGRG